MAASSLASAATSASAAVLVLADQIGVLQPVDVDVGLYEACSSVRERCVDFREAIAETFDGDPLFCDAPRYDLFVRRLKYQKKRRVDVESKAAEDRGERVGGRVANLWLVRAGFGDPTQPDKQVSRFLKCLYSDDVSNVVSAPTIAKAKDAFTELVLKFNRLTLRNTVAKFGDSLRHTHSQSMFVVHLHDEACFRVRSNLAMAYDDPGIVDMSGVRKVNRSASSKVQNHHVTLSLGGERIAWLTELHAMVRKDAPTISATLQSVVLEIIAQARAGLEAMPANTRFLSKLRLVHLLTGDGIGTNQAAARRLFRSVVDTLRSNAASIGVVYRLAMWTCASHVVNTVVQVGVCGKRVNKADENDALCCAASRYFKYLVPVYAEEFGYTLRQIVIHRFQVVPAEALIQGPSAEVQLYRDLYGEGVVPPRSPSS